MSDFSLPKTADTETYSHENHDRYKIAVYTLAKPHGGLDTLQQILGQNSTLTNNYQFSEEDFIGKHLHDVLKHHLRVAEQNLVDPTLFIAVHSENFSKDGVLLINANCDLKGGVGKCRVEASLALLEAVNLQVGNVDWWEIKRADPDEAPPPPLPAEDDVVSTQVPVVFGAYGIKPGANMTKIRDLLEPGWHQRKTNAWRCESVGSYTSGDNPLEQVIKYHPWHCKQKPRLSKQWCVCVDSLDPAEEGVLLLYIDWDGDMTRENLLEVGPQSQIRVERIDVASALNVLAAK